MILAVANGERTPAIFCAQVQWGFLADSGHRRSDGADEREAPLRQPVVWDCGVNNGHHLLVVGGCWRCRGSRMPTLYNINAPAATLAQLTSRLPLSIVSPLQGSPSAGDRHGSFLFGLTD